MYSCSSSCAVGNNSGVRFVGAVTHVWEKIGWWHLVSLFTTKTENCCLWGACVKSLGKKINK